MEEKKATWCVTCQRGHSGIVPQVKPGDQCPICLDHVKSGRIGEDRIGKVWDMDEYKEFIEKKNEVKRMELDQKKNRQIGVKGAEEHRKEIEKEFQSKFDAQKAEIDLMKNMIDRLNSKKDTPIADDEQTDEIKNEYTPTFSNKQKDSQKSK